MKPLLIATVLLMIGAWSAAQASVVLTSTYDVERVNRNTGSYGPPHVSDRNVLAVVNYAWKSWAYLQFDLSQVNNLQNATGMTLRLYEITHGHSPDLKTDIIDVYASPDNWTPATAYGDMPGRLELLDRLYQNTEIYGWAEWTLDIADVADDITDDTLSLIVENTQQTSPWNMTLYTSNTYDQGQFAPQLVIDGPVSIQSPANPVPAPAAVVMGVALLGWVGRRRAGVVA